MLTPWGDTVDSEGNMSRSEVSLPSSAQLNSIGVSAILDGEASFCTTQEELNRKHWKKGKKGAIVNVDPAEFPHQEFEIADAISERLCRKGFTFQRQARRSEILSLGIVARPPRESAFIRDGESPATNLSPYTKATEDMAMSMYLAVIVGFGSLGIPAAFRMCGILPGLFVIIGFSLVHCFLAHRIIDVPELTGADLGGFGDIGDELFSRWGSLVARFCVLLMWFSACLVFFFVLIYYLVPLLCYIHIRIENEFWCMFVEAVLMALVIPSTLVSDAKRLRNSAKWSLRAMTGILAVVAIASTTNFYLHYSELEYNWWIPQGTERQTARAQVIDGMKVMGMTMGGLPILPYIVADMMHPHKAKVMVNKAVMRFTGFFIAIGLIGYIGFGNAVKGNVMVSMLFADGQFVKPYVGFFWWTVQFLSFFMAIKCFTSFPLLVWPLFRELDSYLDLDNSPAVAMSLPWAISRLSRWKVYFRLALCAAIFAVRRACPNWHVISALVSVPVNFCQLVLLPIFSVAAVYYRFDYMKDQATIMVMGRRMTQRDTGGNIFGDTKTQLGCTILIGVGTIVLGFVLVGDHIHEFWASVLYLQSHPRTRATCGCGALAFKNRTNSTNLTFSA